MNGTIVSYFEKQKKAGGSYYNVVMNVGGSQSQYLCTDPATMAKVKEGVGNDLEFYTFKSKDGTATFMSLPKAEGATGAKKSYAKQDTSKNESFASAYAKDIVVACIGQGIIKSSKEIDATLAHYFASFLAMLNTSIPSE